MVVKVGAISALPLGAAVTAALICDFGESAKLAFYSGIAPVLPVVALALIVEQNALLMPRVRHMAALGAPDIQITASAVEAIVPVVAYLATGEFAALYALAAGNSSTFLLTLASASLLGLILLLLGWLRLRYVPYFVYEAWERTPKPKPGP